MGPTLPSDPRRVRGSFVTVPSRWLPPAFRFSGVAAPIPEPILVEVRRNGVVEAWHRVHAVAVQGGEIVASAGDPQLVSFMRSSSKPLQALPLVRARDDLAD